MARTLELQWHKPIPCVLSEEDGIRFRAEELTAIPQKPGLYAFGYYENSVTKLFYIGMSDRSLKSRVPGSLKERSRVIKNRLPKGCILQVFCATLHHEPGEGALDSLERVMISWALENNHELIQDHHTHPTEYTIESFYAELAHNPMKHRKFRIIDKPACEAI